MNWSDSQGGSHVFVLVEAKEGDEGQEVLEVPVLRVQAGDDLEHVGAREVARKAAALLVAGRVEHRDSLAASPSNRPFTEFCLKPFRRGSFKRESVPFRLT